MKPETWAEIVVEKAKVAAQYNKPPYVFWTPNPDGDSGEPNPQRLALESDADELFYGGAAGGGKSDLALGLAFTQHLRSIIFRRVAPNLRALIQRSIDIVGTDEYFNKSLLAWNLPDKRYVRFAAIQYEADKKKYQGQPHDLYVFDELTEFTRTQYMFVTAWNRTTVPGQRTRIVATGNPPTDESGMWIMEEWAPWLDDRFEDRAKPGELRWYYYDDQNHIIWKKDDKPVTTADGVTKHPRSRTFIPAKLADNPHLTNDPAYISVLDSLPEPLRSILREGLWTASMQSDPWQVIPIAWVRQAQMRWMEMYNSKKLPKHITAVGVDVARGGRDETCVSKRREYFWDEVISSPGAVTVDGPTAAKVVVDALGDIPADAINVDVIGVGSSCFDVLKGTYPEGTVFDVNVAERSEFIAETGQLKMRNVRSEVFWRMREILNPANGHDAALPPDSELLGDLCTPRYKLTTAGVLIENKEEVKDRLGRSPNRGDAVLLTLYDGNRKPKPAGKTEQIDMDVYKIKRTPGRAIRNYVIGRRRDNGY